MYSKHNEYLKQEFHSTARFTIFHVVLLRSLIKVSFVIKI